MNNTVRETSSGLPVQLTSSTTRVCTVVHGKVHVVHAGSCALTASQAGDDEWEAAPDRSVTFTIAKAPLTITAASAARPRSTTARPAASGPGIGGTPAGPVRAQLG